LGQAQATAYGYRTDTDSITEQQKDPKGQTDHGAITGQSKVQRSITIPRGDILS